MPIATTLYDSILALHIAAVIVAFGVTFAYPLIYAVGLRSEQRSMPAMHRILRQIDIKVTTPGLAVALAAGIYLAADGSHFKEFFVQWGFGAIIVLGGLVGAFFAPSERRLAELADRDVAAAGTGEVTWSEEYLALRRRLESVGTLAGVLILATVFFMTVKP